MTRGFVSPTYAATTSLKVAGVGCGGCEIAEAEWPTYVTGILWGRECFTRIWCGSQSIATGE
jgi:hypothetical protein